MKRPIDWHRECLGNARANLTHEIQRHEEKGREIAEFTNRLAFYQEQINAAVQEGIAEFDREKFMKTRAKRVLEQKRHIGEQGPQEDKA